MARVAYVPTYAAGAAPTTIDGVLAQQESAGRRAALAKALGTGSETMPQVSSVGQGIANLASAAVEGLAARHQVDQEEAGRRALGDALIGLATSRPPGGGAIPNDAPSAGGGRVPAFAGGGAAMRMPGAGRTSAGEVYQGLVARGVPTFVAAGMAGNIAGESGFRLGVSDNRGEGSTGLIQARGPRLAALQQLGAQTGRDPLSLDNQLDHIVGEFRGSERKAFDIASQAGSPGEAAYLLAKHYERPASWALAQSAPGRISAAEDTFRRFGPGAATPQPAANTAPPDAMPTDNRPAYAYPVGNEPGAYGRADGPPAGRPRGADLPARGATPAGYDALGNPDGLTPDGYAIPPAPVATAPSATPRAAVERAAAQVNAPADDVAALFAPAPMGDAQGFTAAAAAAPALDTLDPDTIDPSGAFQAIPAADAAPVAGDPGASVGSAASPLLGNALEQAAGGMDARMAAAAPDPAASVAANATPPVPSSAPAFDPGVQPLPSTGPAPGTGPLVLPALSPQVQMLADQLAAGGGSVPAGSGTAGGSVASVPLPPPRPAEFASAADIPAAGARPAMLQAAAPGIDPRAAQLAQGLLASDGANSNDAGAGAFARDPAMRAPVPSVSPRALAQARALDPSLGATAQGGAQAGYPVPPAPAAAAPASAPPALQPAPDAAPASASAPAATATPAADPRQAYALRILASPYATPGLQTWALGQLGPGKVEHVDAGDRIVLLNERGQQIGTIAKSKAAEPYTLGENQRRFDAGNNLVAEGAPKREEYTLGEGQVRFGPNGEVVARGLPKDTRGQRQPQRIEVDNPDGTKRTLLYDPERNQLVTPEQMGAPPYVPPAAANPYAMSGKSSEGERNAAGFANRMVESHNIINGLETVGTSPVQSGLAKVPGVGNYAVSADAQRLQQAQRDFVNSILRRESGAAIGKDEFDNARRQYFPQPGDGPDVIAQKRANRETAIQGVMGAAGPGYAPPSSFKPGAPRAEPSAAAPAPPGKIGPPPGSAGTASAPVVTRPAPAPAVPKVGDEMDGYVFQGGDPSKAASWKRR